MRPRCETTAVNFNMLYAADIIVQKHQANMYVCQFTMKGLQGNSPHVL